MPTPQLRPMRDAPRYSDCSRSAVARAASRVQASAPSPTRRKPTAERPTSEASYPDLTIVVLSNAQGIAFATHGSWGPGAPARLRVQLAASGRSDLAGSPPPTRWSWGPGAPAGLRIQGRGHQAAADLPLPTSYRRARHTTCHRSSRAARTAATSPSCPSPRMGRATVDRRRTRKTTALCRSSRPPEPRIALDSYQSSEATQLSPFSSACPHSVKFLMAAKSAGACVNSATRPDQCRASAASAHIAAASAARRHGRARARTSSRAACRAALRVARASKRPVADLLPEVVADSARSPRIDRRRSRPRRGSAGAGTGCPSCRARRRAGAATTDVDVVGLALAVRRRSSRSHLPARRGAVADDLVVAYRGRAAALGHVAADLLALDPPLDVGAAPAPFRRSISPTASASVCG